MNSNTEYYFQLYLTENEHYCVEDDIFKYCRDNGLTMNYYRPLKHGHEPCFRECKVTGADLRAFKKWLMKNSPPLLREEMDLPHENPAAKA